MMLPFSRGPTTIVVQIMNNHRINLEANQEISCESHPCGTNPINQICQHKCDNENIDHT